MREEKGFLEKTKGFLLSPIETFRATRPDTLYACLEYALVWLVIDGALIGIAIRDVLPGMALGVIPGMILNMFPIFPSLWAFVALVIVGGILDCLIGGAWVHLWVYVCGGRKNYTQTVKALAYGATPRFVLGWIPFVGIIGGIWATVVAILGLRELHEISTGRAVAAYLLSIVVAAIITVAIVAATI